MISSRGTFPSCRRTVDWFDAKRATIGCWKVVILVIQHGRLKSSLKIVVFNGNIIYTWGTNQQTMLDYRRVTMLHITLAFNTIFMHNKMADALGETGDGYTITKSFLNHQILKTLNEYPNCPNCPKPQRPQRFWSKDELAEAGVLFDQLDGSWSATLGTPKLWPWNHHAKWGKLVVNQSIPSTYQSIIQWLGGN